MANGKSAQETVEHVKLTIHSLETSPSCHAGTSPIAHGGGGAKKGGGKKGFG